MVWHFKPHMRAYRFVGHKVEYNTYYAYLAKSNFVNEESIMIAIFLFIFVIHVATCSCMDPISFNL